jgi:hypothetical protein
MNVDVVRVFKTTATIQCWGRHHYEGKRLTYRGIKLSALSAPRLGIVGSASRVVALYTKAEVNGRTWTQDADEAIDALARDLKAMGVEP